MSKDEPKLAIEASNLDDTRTSITAGECLTGPLLFNANGVDKTVLCDDAPVVVASDRNGNRFDINVWGIHDLDVEWQEDHWYAISAARGRVWRTTKGTIKRRLSTTADTVVHHLGPDLDPAPVENPPEEATEPELENNYRQAKEGTGSGDEKTAGSQDSAGSQDLGDINERYEEGSMIDDIIDEF